MSTPDGVPGETQGDVLNETMARYRISVKDLAEAAGISAVQVSRYRNIHPVNSPLNNNIDHYHSLQDHHIFVKHLENILDFVLRYIRNQKH